MYELSLRISNQSAAYLENTGKMVPNEGDGTLQIHFCVLAY
jgi:hypothetical protein